MSNYLRAINLFNKNRTKLNHKILIIGRGRWSRVITKELISNFPNIKKILIYSSKFKNKKIKNSNKKIIFINSLKLIREQDVKYIIISNKNSDHLKYIKIFLKTRNNILCEKPLILTKRELVNLESNLKKKKTFLTISMQFFYAFYFHFINKKFVKNKKIEKITIDWFDKKNEKRNGIVKKHDMKINFIEDIFYHVYSILSILAKIKNYSFNFQPIKRNNIEHINFIVNKKIITYLNSSRVYDRRTRNIKLYFYNKDLLFINFSKDNDVKVKFNGKLVKIPNKLMSKTIKYQLYFFLKSGKNDKSIVLNNFKNLKNFFKNLYLLKEKL